VSDAKTEILSRIRSALGERPRPPEVPRAYLRASGLSQAELIELFVKRVTDYRATVHRTTETTLTKTISEVCRLRRAETLVVPTDLPESWLPPEVGFVRDEGLANEQLGAADGVLSGCALAVAQTGTLVLDGGAQQGRRALSLLPDLHLCVVFARQIVGTLPEAVAALKDAAARPLTLISGPSATSDIELSRVEGVHGPRTLDILLVTDHHI
jgi:L-lactate dehydrogenase complex protein LldG